ncbi:hypothetical protein SPRG_21692, partial [Saprolegnia parasitica CBS 223.65]
QTQRKRDRVRARSRLARVELLTLLMLVRLLHHCVASERFANQLWTTFAQALLERMPWSAKQLRT